MYDDLENPKFDISDPEAPVTYAQGRTIAMACGGIKTICANYEEGDSAAEALTEMGLNKGKASEVIDALKRARLNAPNFSDPAKARKAAGIAGHGLPMTSFPP